MAIKPSRKSAAKKKRSPAQVAATKRMLAARRKKDTVPGYYPKPVDFADTAPKRRTAKRKPKAKSWRVEIMKHSTAPWLLLATFSSKALAVNYANAIWDESHKAGGKLFSVRVP
jgi:hypothetical protein